MASPMLLLFNVGGQLLKIASCFEHLGPGFADGLLSTREPLSLESLFHHEDLPAILHTFLELAVGTSPNGAARGASGEARVLVTRMVTDFGR